MYCVTFTAVALQIFHFLKLHFILPIVLGHANSWSSIHGKDLLPNWLLERLILFIYLFYFFYRHIRGFSNIYFYTDHRCACVSLCRSQVLVCGLDRVQICCHTMFLSEWINKSLKMFFSSQGSDCLHQLSTFQMALQEEKASDLFFSEWKLQVWVEEKVV